MSAYFYFRKGLRFWDWHRMMGTVCDFEVCPAGAPLGEEVTKTDGFKEAWCNVEVRFAGASEACRAEVTFRSSPSFDSDSPLNKIWNPEQDSLIHYLRMGFNEFEVIPLGDNSWKEWMPAAKEAYWLYKRMFLVLNCDQAESDDAFRWERGAAQQRVIFAYENNRTLTHDEFSSTQWAGLKNTSSAFPEL